MKPPMMLVNLAKKLIGFCFFVINRLFGGYSLKVHIILTFVSFLLFAFATVKGQMVWIIVTLIILTGTSCLVIKGALERKSGHGKKRHIRGTLILSYKEMCNRLKEYKTRLPIGQYKLPIEYEVKHCLIVGRPGTGKTVALSQVISEIYNNKLSAIIHDSKGDFVPSFYNSEIDYILNPFDERCINWNIFNDIKRETDFNLIACSLIPENLNSDPYWYEVPRKILSEILSYCWHSGKRTNKELWKTISLPARELAELLKSNNGTSHNDLIGNEKTSANLTSIILSKCRVFYYMQHLNGDFSVNDWISAPNGSIFLTNRADIKDTIKPILTLFIDVCAARLLSLPDDIKNRLFFMLDEFGALSKINNIVNLLTLSRSKGGAVFIGVQDIGNIEKLYGKEHRQTIVNACGNSVIFAVEDPDTAEFFSKKIGDIEYYETMQSASSTDQGLLKSSDTKSVQEEKRSERAVITSEIQQLKDRNAIVRFADIGTGVTLFEYVDRPMKVPAFIERESLLLSTESQANMVNELNIPVESINMVEEYQGIAEFESI
jgi:type IV secretory pathway TraG/TraD family ATPase VirD4